MSDGPKDAVVDDAYDGTAEGEQPRDAWMSSRHGARAGRGFHYQDVVGAWLAAGLFSGEMLVDRIVPEGREDLSCEGHAQWQVQVKSRQAHVSDFTTAEAARHLADMWDRRHLQTSSYLRSERLILVLERPVAGTWFRDWARPLAESDDGAVVLTAMRSIAADREWPDGELEELAQAVGIFTLTWEDATDQIRDRVVRARSTYPVAADMVGRAFREAVAESADLNASASSAAQAWGIDRSRITQIADEVLGLVDREALEEALAEGLCEAVSFKRPETMPSEYFEGVAAQPWHISAGLPAPRPDLVDQAIDALDRDATVLLTGPSGVGKSTAMWATAYATKHVLWYRVRRLDEAAIERLIRLARASRPSKQTPVGFLVDGVGVGDAAAWDSLHRAAAAVPGILLIGTARTEDLLPLRTLPDCVRVDVALDEAVAQRIFEKLRDSEPIEAVHWREAYEAAAGLTMEYTYLLTHGRRLADVLAEQISRRVDERRDDELEILALAATAHRWDASLSVASLQDCTGLNTGTLRAALARLNDEHLLRATNGTVYGLHSLRSRFLSESAHEFPPPLLKETVRRLIGVVEPNQLTTLVFGAFSDHAEIQEDVLLNLAARITALLEPRVLRAVLDGLRAVDLSRDAQSWAAVMDRHGVEPPLRGIAFQIAMLPSDTDVELKPGLQEAIAELRAQRNDRSPSCERLIDEIGQARVNEILAGCSTVADAIGLMAALAESGFQAPETSLAAWRDSNLAGLLLDSAADEFGELLEAARLTSEELARVFFDLAGGEKAATAKLMEHSPWLTEVKVLQGEPPIAFARSLHISDEIQGDPGDSNRELARVVLRCFPMCDSVDVQALWPGGAPIRISGFDIATSRLERRYDHSLAEVTWNRRRGVIAAAAFGTANRSERVVLAIDVLQKLSEYLNDIVLVWIVSRNRPADMRRVEARRSHLRELKDQIRQVARTSSPFGDDAAFDNDALHSLVDGIIDNLSNRIGEPNAALAAFVGDSLRGFVDKVAAEEEWGLVDATAPASLEEIGDALECLHRVLSELAHGTTAAQELITAARSGRSDRAIGRAADVALRAAERRHRHLWEGVEGELRTGGVAARIQIRPHSEAAATEWPPMQVAAIVDVPTLAEWFSQAETAIRLLTPAEGEPSYHPGILILPLVEGRPVPQLSLQVISSVLPAGDAYNAWSGEFTAAHMTETTDTFSTAHQALQVLSGLAVLSTFRETISLQWVADDNVNQFTAALNSLQEQHVQDAATEAVIEYLLQVANEVQQEINDLPRGNGDSEPLSVSMARGAAGVLGGSPEAPSSRFTSFNGMLAFCFQVDVNRRTALEMLVGSADLPDNSE